MKKEEPISPVSSTRIALVAFGNEGQQMKTFSNHLSVLYITRTMIGIEGGSGGVVSENQSQVFTQGINCCIRNRVEIAATNDDSATCCQNL